MTVVIISYRGKTYGKKLWIKSNKKLLLFASAVAVLVAMSLWLVSCGSGGSSSPGTDGTTSTYSISGQVTSGGAGLTAVTMTLSGAASSTATTDDGGNYTFSGLSNGSYTVTPSKSGYTFNPSSSLQTVSSGNIASVNFTAALSQAVQIVACPSSGTTDVTIQDFIFFPSNAIVSINEIVKWTNNGPSTHTVTSGTSSSIDGKFDSGNLAQGATVCMKFPASGTYPYLCSIHDVMTGSVTVQ